MGLFDSLVKTVINVAVLPIEVAKDVVTLGGSLNEKTEPYTVERLKKIAEKLDEACD